MEKFLFILEAILCLIVFVIVVTPRLIDYVYKRDQLKLVKKGYLRPFKAYTKCHKLDDATEIVLVELSEISSLHREMLLVYNYSLGRQAAAKFVEIFYKKVELWDFFKEFLSKKGRYEIDALIKNGDKVSQAFIIEWIEQGGTLSDNQITALSDSENLRYIFKKYCETYPFLEEVAERRLVELASKDESFFKVLSKYIRQKENCSTREIDSTAEDELFKHKELFDILVMYIKITRECPTGENFQVLASYAKEEKRYWKLLLDLFEMTRRPSDELIEYGINNADEDFLNKLNVFIEKNGLKERHQILLAKAHRHGGSKYLKCLETQIEYHGLCESARDILIL